MKKRNILVAFGLVLALLTGALAACSQGETTVQDTIYPVTREDGSGTRGAFIELFGIEQKDADGNKIDYTTDLAEITNSTSVMMTTVAGNKASIGYVSLGSLGDEVKAVEIDGVVPTVENIKNGTYKVSRPFNIVTSEQVSPQAQDFIDFILSDEGQKIVKRAATSARGSTGAFTGGNVSGKITVAGSSSVTPIMEKLREGYLAINGNLEIEVQQNESTTGVNSAIEGVCDIGMASRELKESELEQGVSATVIAMDGIAVIVNLENEVSSLTSEQVKGIFTGELTSWSELG